MLLPLLALLPAVLAAPTTSLAKGGLFARQATCSNSGASCPTPSSTDTCCTNSPGGYFVLTQFWDTAPVTGPTNSWTVHGLWPDNCDGSYDAFCDASREHSNIRSILQSGGGQASLDYMNVYWKDYNGDDESFWSHEWNKHGTCVSTLETNCYGSSYVNQEEVVAYFDKTVELFKSLPTYSWLTAAGIVPSNTATYTLAQLQAVASARTGKQAVWNCRSGVLGEVWWGYTTTGPIEGGTFTHASPVGSLSTCPSTGIKWLPKTSGSSTSTTSSPSSSSTSAPSGTKFMNVVNAGSTKGCLISTGKWMVGSTCAGYTVTSSGSTFTLSTSKGPCQISSAGAFVCGSGLAATPFSSDAAGNLVYASSATFHASAIPSGTSQVTVVTGSAAQSINLHFG